MSDWRHSAACVGHDPELWFSTHPKEQETAIGICRTCPVIKECEAFANLNQRICGYPLVGIWGGRLHGAEHRH